LNYRKRLKKKKIVADLGLGEPIDIMHFSMFITIYKYSENGVIYEIEQDIRGYFNIRMDSPVLSILHDAVLEIGPYANAAQSCIVDYGARKVICAPVYVSVMQRD
jgi:hypothetical protein